MSITANVTNHIVFTGDQQLELIYNSGERTNSPCMQELVTLAIGNNTITVPDVDDFTLHGLAIVPPASNVEEITLKGVGGDTGITLNSEMVSVLQFGATPPASLVLSVAAEVAGLRLVWF